MSLKYQLLFKSRIVVLIWASLWMLAAPLFHVHPEADHRHGQAGHIHGGTVHTAWSTELECEFGSHGQVDRTERSAQGSISYSAQFSHFGDNHTEFSLSILRDSTDRASLKPSPAQLYACSARTGLHAAPHLRIATSVVSIQPSTPFTDTTSSRAPPHLFA